MMSKEALDKLFKAVDEELLYEQCGVIFATELTKVIEKDLDRLEQLEKALDILKEKVYLKVKKYCKEDYENPYKLEVEMDYSYDLTQKDFELLKEVFCDVEY